LHFHQGAWLIMTDSTVYPMAVSNSQVAVVIVNHNAGEALAACLKSALSQSREVVLVDNASESAEFESAVEPFAGNPLLQIIRSSVNAGFAVACNKGAAASSAPCILFLNPDCIALPGLLEKMSDTLHANSRTGMVGALLLNPDGTEQGGGRRSIPTPWKSFVRAFGLWRILRRHDFHMESTSTPILPVEVDAISGACMMVKRSAFEEVGGFDEGFFLHCEDLDLCMEFKKHGWNIVFSPSAIVLHGKGVCSRSRPVFVEWHKHRGMLRFYGKHFRSTYPVVLHAFVTVAVWLRFALVAARLSIKSKFRLENASSCLRTHPNDGSPASASGVGVLGASSFVGHALLQIMAEKGAPALAFSRNPSVRGRQSFALRELSASAISAISPIREWISLCPIDALAGLLPLLELAGTQRLVAVSSTSKFTKINSADISEHRLAARLDAAESRIRSWGAARGVRVVILRTTMIYDGIHDANIAAIVRFVSRFGWYPLLGTGRGLRQPIHARDVASACFSALRMDLPRVDYNISGGETLAYRGMVERIFESQGLPPRFIALSPLLLRIAVPILRLLPRFRHLSYSMFQRMNEDLAFDHFDAARDMDFSPCAFQPKLSGL
jgi:hypothetical protein